MKAKFATKRIVLLVLAAVMLATAVVGGTLAYLQFQTAEMKNTFTIGNVQLAISEPIASTHTNNGNKFEIKPGYKIAKDPVITVKENSFACYLFVEIKESSDFDDFMTYEVITQNDKGTVGNVLNVYKANGGEFEKLNSWAGTAGTTEKPTDYYWTQLTKPDGTPVENVYYMEIEEYVTKDTNFYVLKDNIVSTKSYNDPPEYTNTSNHTETTPLSLSFTAYAIQRGGFYDNAAYATAGEAVYAAWQEVYSASSN